MHKVVDDMHEDKYDTTTSNRGAPRVKADMHAASQLVRSMKFVVKPANAGSE